MLNVELGPRLILGIAGTGKTTLLAQAALARPESVADALVLAPTRAAADDLRVRVARAVGDGAVPNVQTFYSLAADVVDEFGPELGYGDVRVLDASAQDSHVRQVLALMAKEPNAVRWPGELSDALATGAFVRALRQLIARCQIAGVTPDQLAELAEPGRSEWRSAAEFLRRYYDVLDAEGVVDYAGLVTLAAAIASNSRVAQVLQRRFAGIYVDQFEDCDPAHVRLLHAIAAPDRDTWVCADPTQTVDAFRGASGLAVSKFGELFARGRSLDTITTVLTNQRRFGPQIGNTLRIGWTAGRPHGVPPHQLNAFRSATGLAGKTSSLAIIEYESGSQVGPAVCQQIKQAWIDGEIDSLADVAVIGRTWHGELADVVQELRRQRLPIQVAQDSQPLRRSRSVRAVLDLVELDPERPDETVVRDLLSIGWQVGPVQFRRMQRAMRSAGHSWSDVLLGDGGAVGDVEISGLITLSSAVGRVRQEIRHGNLQRAFATAADALSVGGRSSITDLLAYVSRRVTETADLLDLPTLAADIRKQAIAPAIRNKSTTGVTVTTVHQARGREWKLVLVCDLAEGTWPKVTRDCDLLGVDELSRLTGQIEEHDNILANEKRLFSLACSRASDALVLVAPSSEPSRFVAHLRRGSDMSETSAAEGRELTVAAVVARLWQIVDAPQSSSEMREEARARIRQLAKAGHRDASPTARWGVQDWTTNDQPVRNPHEPVRMSGSSWEAISRCSLRWFLEHEVGARSDSAAAGFGTAVHAVAEELATNHAMNDDAVRDRLTQMWELIDFDADWLAREELSQAVEAVQRFRYWQAGRSERQLLATEMPFDRVIDTPAGAVQLVGKIDRLEADPSGRLHIVDLKTKRQPESRTELAQHRQLALYQLAIGDQQPETEIAGAELVQLRISAPDGVSPKVQQQDAVDVSNVRERLAEAVEIVQHEQFRPSPSNKNCRTCPLVSVCPAQMPEVPDDDSTLSTADASDRSAWIPS